MQATKALLLSNMLSSTESVENAEIANFEASCVTPLDITVDIDPVQDLHGYDNPWPGGGGKNLVPSTLDNLMIRNTDGTWNNNVYTLNGLTFTVNSDGSIKINGTASAKTYITFIQNNAGVPMGAGDYITHKTGQSGVSMTAVKNGSYWMSASTTNTTGSLAETANIAFYMSISNNTVVDNLTVYPMVEQGSSASDYSPYSNICPISGWTKATISHSGADTSNPTEYEIPFSTEVYGGKLNVETGELVVDRAKSTLPTYTNRWVKSTSYPGGFYTSPSQIAGGTPKSNTPFICSHAKTATSISEYLNGTCYCDGSLNFRLMTTDTTVQEWIDYINEQTTNGTPIEICYYLATPITLTLDPVEIRSLLGDNNVWADTGNVSVRNITCNADFLELLLKTKLIGEC